MARGDKNYDSVVRNINKGQSADKKISAIHKMVEALIQEDNEEAIEQLRAYLQMKSRSILLGEEDDESEEEMEKDSDGDDEDESEDEEKDDDESEESEDDDDESEESEDDDDESEESEDDDDDVEMEEDEEKSKKKKKKKVKEGMMSTDGGARTRTHYHETPPTPVRDKYSHKKPRGEKKGKDQEYHSNGKQSPKGDSLSNVPHRSNDTRSSRGQWHETPPMPKDDNKSDHRVAKRSNRV